MRSFFFGAATGLTLVFSAGCPGLWGGGCPPMDIDPQPLSSGAYQASPDREQGLFFDLGIAHANTITTNVELEDERMVLTWEDPDGASHELTFETGEVTAYEGWY